MNILVFLLIKTDITASIMRKIIIHDKHQIIITEIRMRHVLFCLPYHEDMNLAKL